MGEAFIKIHRKLLDWEWYDDINTFRLFTHCLLKANWKAASWHGVEVNPGQFITSLSVLSEETGLSVRQVRVALDHLIMTGELTSKCQSKYRIITVNNWDKYQLNDKQNDKQVTSKRQADDKQVTTIEEYKEYKEKKEEKELKNKGAVYFPEDELLNRAFSDYVAMRKQIKKPMTDRAISLAQNKLNKLAGADNDLAIEILNQSIMNCWQDLYPLKTETKSKGIDWSKV